MSFGDIDGGCRRGVLTFRAEKGGVEGRDNEWEGRGADGDAETRTAVGTDAHCLSVCLSAMGS